MAGEGVGLHFSIGQGTSYFGERSGGRSENVFDTRNRAKQLYSISMSV